MRISFNRHVVCLCTTLLISELMGARVAHAYLQDVAIAQPDDEIAIAVPDEEVDKEESRIITPRKSDRRSDVQRRQSLVASRQGKVDWEAVEQLVNETRTQDQIRARQAFDPTQAIRGSEITGTTSPPPGLRVLPADSLSKVPSLRQEAIARTQTPILIPVTARSLDATRLYTNTNAYTAIVELGDGARVQFLGTIRQLVPRNSRIIKERAAQRRRVQRRLEGLNANYVVSQHEEGIELSFSKFNVAYMVSVYCDDPARDRRCTNEDFVRSLASNVALLNAEQGGIQ